MYGRFTRFHSWADIHRMYSLLPAKETGRNTEARYNIAPTEDVYFVTAGEEGGQKVRQGRWWLVPWWAKELPNQPMFNARIETADTGGAFKECLEVEALPEPGRRLLRMDEERRGRWTRSLVHPPRRHAALQLCWAVGT